jgi:hypothetical protein
MKNEHEFIVLKIEACNFEKTLFDNKSMIANCILENKYKTRAMIDNDCIDYSFIDIDIAQQVCKVLRISSLKLNKSREVKKYDEKRNKNITYAIYSFMTIQVHTKNSIFMMIITLD